MEEEAAEYVFSREKSTRDTDSRQFVSRDKSQRDVENRDLGALNVGDAHGDTTHKRDARKKDVYFADLREDNATTRTRHEDDPRESNVRSNSAKAAGHDTKQTPELHAHRDVQDAGGVERRRLGEREAVRGEQVDSNAHEDSNQDESARMRAKMEADKARIDAEKKERETQEMREREAREKQDRELRDREESEKREREEKLRREKEEQERQEVKRMEEEVWFSVRGMCMGRVYICVYTRHKNSCCMPIYAYV